jgi:hypothetical protein
MEIAGSTLLVVAALLPGAAFYVGVFSKERLYRDIVRASTVAEVGGALLVALIVHSGVFYVARQAFHFDPRAFLRPFLFPRDLTEDAYLSVVSADCFAFCLYVIVLSIVMYFFGRLVAWAMAQGILRSWATHQWVYDLRGGRGRGVVTTYVMTTTILNDKVLMYEGQLSELFLQPDGRISYLVLKDCSRYFMAFGPDETVTGPRLNILRNVSLPDGASASLLWNYFTITGDNIANVLFKKNPEIGVASASRETLSKLERLLTEVHLDSRLEG